MSSTIEAVLPEKTEQAIVKIIQEALAKGEVMERETNIISFMPAKTVAKIVRVLLKDSFPGVKFSVRAQTFAGGDAVHVSFKEGEVDKQEVREAIDWFSCIGFDGMTDSTYYTSALQVGQYSLKPTSYISVSEDYR